MNYIVELAEINDIDTILKIYSDRMKWFKENEIKQWSRYLENHPKQEFIESIKNNNFYIIKQNDDIIGCFELSHFNSNWNNNNMYAYYLNKIVTKVGYRNLGKTILDTVKRIAKNDGKKYLRLDCLKSNNRLNEIYEKYGFKFVRYGKNEKYSYALRELKIGE